MNPEGKDDRDQALSEIRLPIEISESWLQRMIDAKNFSLPLNEQYQLHHFQIGLKENLISVAAEIVDKPGSFIEIYANPRWDAVAQRLFLDHLKIQTKSKNVMVKSAGWFASAFMHGKIDIKLEEKVNELYKKLLDDKILQTLNIPVAAQSALTINAKSVVVEQMSFLDGKIGLEVKAEGSFHLRL